MGKGSGRFAGPVCAAGLVGVLAAIPVPARADSAEDKFVADITHANAVATSIPGTPERWIAAGYATCDRITRTSAQGLPIRAAINNEVIAATTFNNISRQNAVALVTYAILDLCPQLIPRNDDPPG